MTLPKDKRIQRRWDNMDRLLMRFGNGEIDREEFFAHLKAYGLTQDDIDKYVNGGFQ